MMAEKMNYSEYVVSVQGIVQMKLDMMGLDITIRAAVCETTKDNKRYVGVELRNTTEIELMEFVERYYLEEAYKLYLDGEETISDIADSMIMQYITAFGEALDG